MFLVGQFNTSGQFTAPSAIPSPKSPLQALRTLPKVNYLMKKLIVCSVSFHLILHTRNTATELINLLIVQLQSLICCFNPGLRVPLPPRFLHDCENTERTPVTHPGARPANAGCSELALINTPFQAENSCLLYHCYKEEQISVSISACSYHKHQILAIAHYAPNLV